MDIPWIYRFCVLLLILDRLISGVLCFFESTDDTLHAPHGQGRLSGAADVAAAADCWRRVHEVLGKGQVRVDVQSLEATNVTRASLL